MAVDGLAKRFHEPGFYQTSTPQSSYQFLPFRFSRLNGKVFVSNEVGEYLLLEQSEFNDFTAHKLNQNSDIYHDLKSKHFLFDDENSSAPLLLSIKLRTKYQHIRQFTNLHIFVVSLRCDYSCPYCQVSRQSEDKRKFDMSEETAIKAIDFVFKSPSPALKFEFQGGESLLNLPLIKFIVKTAKKRNDTENRDLQFVIATNLSYIDDDVLDFCRQHDIYISSSLDGPAWLHNKNRPRPGRNGYELTVTNIQKVRDALGPDKIASLMTTTEASLGCVRDIIDEYIDNGYHSIFLRPLSPYGFAIKTKAAYKYDVARWLEFYKEGMEYILELNENGVPIREDYSSMILTKLLTPYNPGYVDLQSPSGAGISAIVFNYDGNVYASDESRMLAEMGDDHFNLGNLNSDSYEEIIGSDTLLQTIEDSITESVPMCRDCAYQPYCGSDPVYHYATQHDVIGHKAKSGFCQKNMGVIEYLIAKLESDSGYILRQWAQR